MKRMNDKTKIYEILYKILRFVLYFEVASESQISHTRYLKLLARLRALTKVPAQ